MTSDHWRQALAPFISSKPWIVTGEVLAGTVAVALALRKLGATRVLCVGVIRGSGGLPAEDGFDQILIDRPLPADMMGSLREGERLLASPPPEVLAAVDAFDPRGEALVMAHFIATAPAHCGRPVWGARPPAWLALEDKTTIDALFEEAGVAVAPHRVVPATAPALAEAAAALDEGAGTVWAGDAREGFHGGAAFTRWVRGPRDAAEAVSLLSASCDVARVMPFLEGVPCSVHGFVLPDGVIAFRPCEMVVLRRPDPPVFLYAGAATSWDPPAAGRAQLRAAALRVGAALRDRLGYRGAFTLDGVMSAQGFRPTELNPRYGAALMALGRPLPEVPLLLLHFAAVAGLALDWQGAALERRLIAAGDATRQLSVGVLTPHLTQESQTFSISGPPDFLPEADPARAWADVLLGPSAVGTFLRVSVRRAQVPVGPPAGPLAAAVLNSLSTRFSLLLPPLTAAHAV